MSVSQSRTTIGRVLYTLWEVVASIAIVCAVFVGLPFGWAMLNSGGDHEVEREVTTEEEALRNERDWRRDRELAAWREARQATLRDLNATAS